ncbi:hypothetical protein BCL69_101258 [Nitrosomonas communis]|uniref:Uncharacterized protein n=1 Tax=Nitrosomonas communis TaxID=44574 RepID=A0A5D3YDT7_9PROT|nr:hypothetical protein BCL69_101258 [Nitrosomonas communis]
MKLTDVSEEQVQRAVNRLGHRPRSYPDLAPRMRYSYKGMGRPLVNTPL